MIADSADIRFECNKCGQHLVVEAAGAGLTADCPICNTAVTVPPPVTSGRRGLTATVASESSRSAYADPAPDDLRDELIDASLINGKLVGDLGKARGEIARLQQHLKTVGEEYEHLNASTTHTQAELKTFQIERQQFKAELSTLRQKIATAEETLAGRDRELKEVRAKLAGSVSAGEIEAIEGRLTEVRSLAAEWEAKAIAAHKTLDDAARSGGEWKAKAETTAASLTEAVKLAAEREGQVRAAAAAMEQAQKTAGEFAAKIAGLEQSLAAERAHREQVAGELEEKRRELGDMQSQLAALDDELHKTRWRLGEVEAALAGAQETGLRLTTESGDLLRDQSEKLRLAEESNQTLTTRGEQLRRESDALRRDLTDSHSGREVVEIRARMDDAVAERERTAARLSAVEADLHAFTATAAATRTELDQARAERDDALERADALRETRAAMDNQVLRGIIARLNTDLGQRATEVVRLKRERYGLKIAYVLFAIGFLAVLAFALTVLPHALKP